MKKTILFGLCVWLLAIGKAVADNTLSVANVTIPKGGQTTMEIVCDFSTEFVGGQWDVELPDDGKVTPTMANGKPVAAFGFTGTDHFISSSQLKNTQEQLVTKYRFLFASMSSTALPTSGTLMTIVLNADETATVGTVYNAKLSNIELGTSGSAKMNLDDILFTVTIAEDPTSTDNNVIDFTDLNAKAICVANWDTNGDGELSMGEAAAVTDLEAAFSGNTAVKSFDELQYFTGLTAIGVGTKQSLEKVPFWTHTSGWGLDAPQTNQGTPLWVIGEASSQPYGDPSVANFADLSAYEKLIITYSAGSPRVLLNRDVDNGQWNENESQSHLIDNTQGGWSAKYFTTSGNTLTVDLKQIVADKGFAHLHAIKETGWNATITVESMVLVSDLGEITTDKVQGFYGCTALESVTIPANVTSLGDYAFSGCNSLTSVTVNWATPVEITQQCFTNRADATLNVPAGSKVAYATTDYWKEFKNMAAFITQLPPEIIATTPAQGSFNIDPAIKQFTVKFDNPANAARIEATLDGKALTVSPAEGPAEEITMNYAGENLTNGLHTIHITKVYNEGESFDDELFTDSTYTFSVGAPDASDVPIELIPISYFNDCASGSIPEGFLLYADNMEKRVAGGNYTGGSRLFSDFADGGDFTHALYMRTNYLTYGLNDDEHRLTMEAGKTYTLSFNAARWKSNGQYLKVMILNTNGESQFEKTVSCNPDLNGSKAAVNGSSAYSFGFTPTTSGDYELRFVVANNAGGEDAGENWHELLLANVKFGYIPSSYGVAEMLAVNEALGTAQKVQTTYADERYDGAAQTALGDAIDQVLAEKDGYTSPAECSAAVEMLAKAGEALIEHANACNNYDKIIKNGADVVRENAANKFSASELYTQLKSAVSKYHGVSELVNDGTEEAPDWQTRYTYDVLKDDTELKTALTELTNVVELAQKQFTIVAEDVDISPDGTTGVAALVERLRLGAKTLKTLDPENEAIATALNALDDDDAIAKILKGKIKAALRKKMKEDADALFGDDPDTGEPKTIDMTVFVKNPNMYSPAFSTTVPGWETLAGDPKGWTNWDYKNHSITTPYAEDGSLYLEWHQQCTVEQTILDLPAGVYNVYFNANDNSTQSDGGTYVYVKTSEDGAGPDSDVNYVEVSNGSWNRHINNIVVNDGVLTLGFTSGTVSQPFLHYVKLSLVNLFENVDDIKFADAAVKAICVEKWDTDGDGELSKKEAAAVTDLGEAFSGNTAITSFDELQYFTGLTSIGDEAFFLCPELKSITIPTSVTKIHNLAFEGCTGLTSIIIPNSVTSIGRWAFRFCSNLSSITIPNSVTFIGESAFGGYGGLEYIMVEGNNPNYDSRDNCNAIIRKSDNKLITGCKNTVIPNSVTSIGNEAFRGCTDLTSISIPNSVTSIDGRAFISCSNLTSIIIPNSVLSIGESAFQNCSKLTFVRMGTTNPVIIDESVFTNRANATLYVPTGSKAAYEAADYWNEFKEIVVMGDMNKDENIDISDVVLIIDVMADLLNAGEDTKAVADINGDGAVNIGDIIATIDLMIAQLNQTDAARQLARSNRGGQTDLLTGEMDGQRIAIGLNNKEAYTAFQMLVTVPEGTAISGVQLNNVRAKKHVASVTPLSDNQYLVIGYSLSNKNLAGQDGQLLTLTTEGAVSGDIIVSDVIFATADGRSCPLDGVVICGGTTGIGEMKMTDGDQTIYNMNGQRVSKPTRKGMFIINGKKVIK